jgi:hypothetical protein
MFIWDKSQKKSRNNFPAFFISSFETNTTILSLSERAFLGKRLATFYSFIATSKLNGVNPCEYFVDVLPKLRIFREKYR